MLRFSLVSAEAVEATSRMKPQGMATYEERQFYFYRLKKTWDEAQINCHAKGSRLATAEDMNITKVIHKSMYRMRPGNS